MATTLLDELGANFSEFDSQWKADLQTVAMALSAQKAIFQSSYVRIASIQAWRTSVIQDSMEEDCAAFFFEAQNDLLVSHCLAQCGSFRQSLKSLRSCIENIYFSLYYMDHSVELALWLNGKHKMTFTGMHTYFEGHPNLAKFTANQTGLAILAKEYATLSKAVHASAKQFRMTTNLEDPKLWVEDKNAVAQWASREKSVVMALNLLLLHFFHESLQGAKLRLVRESIGLVVGAAKFADIKNRLKVTLI